MRLNLPNLASEIESLKARVSALEVEEAKEETKETIRLGTKRERKKE